MRGVSVRPRPRLPPLRMPSSGRRATSALYFPGDADHDDARPQVHHRPRDRGPARAARSRHRRGRPAPLAADARPRVPPRQGAAPRPRACPRPGRRPRRGGRAPRRDAYREALIEKDILPLTNADVEVVQAEEGKPLIFKATVQVRPGGRRSATTSTSTSPRDRDDRRRPGRQGRRGAARPERDARRGRGPRREGRRLRGHRVRRHARRRRRSRAARPSGCRSSSARSA